MQHVFWNTIRSCLLYILVALIVLSCHPAFTSININADDNASSILSKYIILVFIILFATCFNARSMFSSKLVKTSWGIYILIAVYCVAAMAFFNSNLMVDDLRAIAICIVSIMIGWQMEFDKKNIIRLLLFFAIFSTFVGLMQVLRNVEVLKF